MDKTCRSAKGRFGPFAKPSPDGRYLRENCRSRRTLQIAMVQRKPSLTLAARTGCSATPWMDDRGRPRSFACSQAGRSQETIPRSPRRARVQPPHASHAAASSLIPSCEIPPLPPAGRAVGKAAMRRRHTAAFVRIYAQNLETCMCGPVSTLKVRSVTRCVDGWPPTEEMAEPETDPSFYARSLLRRR
jgi:hypothetical protein